MRVVLVLLLAAVAALAAVVGLLWSQQRRLLYLPAPRAVPPAAAVLPAAEEVSFPTADGLRLTGWFLPAAGPPGRAGRGRSPAVLVCNGNGGNRSLRAPLAAALARAGLAVLLFDYRGYAANPGHPTEAGLAADARAALAYLAARPEVDPARLVYFGESLGAAVALRLAVERPPAALVLRSPFASLAEVGRLHYPWLPVSLLLADRYDSLGRVGGLAAPLLVVAGERDRIVPPPHSRRLFDAAPQPKRFVLLPGADHNDLDLLAGPGLLDEVLAFLGQVPTLAGTGGR
ncbi:MAG TPA: alpha/beta hydrolase [Actinomycetota bacterium]|jgi:uncharacterized protein|nr:alpha/beta hydrolase [Actinomycetota bacterium]